MGREGDSYIMWSAKHQQRELSLPRISFSESLLSCSPSLQTNGVRHTQRWLEQMSVDIYEECTAFAILAKSIRRRISVRHGQRDVRVKSVATPTRGGDRR